MVSSGLHNNLTINRTGAPNYLAQTRAQRFTTLLLVDIGKIVYNLRSLQIFDTWTSITLGIGAPNGSSILFIVWKYLTGHVFIDHSVQIVHIIFIFTSKKVRVECTYSINSHYLINIVIHVLIGDIMDWVQFPSNQNSKRAPQQVARSIIRINLYIPRLPHIPCASPNNIMNTGGHVMKHCIRQ